VLDASRLSSGDFSAAASRGFVDIETLRVLFGESFGISEGYSSILFLDSIRLASILVYQTFNERVISGIEFLGRTRMKHTARGTRCESAKQNIQIWLLD
jgi:hypothetical protein